MSIGANDPWGPRCSQHAWRSILDRLLNRELSAFQARREGLALDKFHYQIIWADVIERTNVRVVQRRDGQRLAMKAFAELFEAGLDGYSAAEPRINCAKHFAHAAGSELRFDTIWSQVCARNQWLNGRRSAGLLLKQSLDFTSHLRIGADKNVSAALARGMIQLLDLPPAFGGHVVQGSSRRLTITDLLSGVQGSGSEEI